MSEYSDLTRVGSATTDVYMVAELLKNSNVFMNIQRFGKVTVLDQNKGDTVSFRRYKKLPLALTPLTEGTRTDNRVDMDKEDFVTPLVQYGSWTELTDKAQLMARDPLLQEAIELMGVQKGETMETIDWNVLSAATSVFLTGTAATVAQVAVPFGLKDLRKATNYLETESTPKITKVLTASAAYETRGIKASYIALCHTNLKNDFLNLNDTYQGKDDVFIPVNKYPNQGDIFESEIGSVEDIRVLTSPLYLPAAGAGATIADDSVRTTLVGGNEKADLYNIVILGKDAFNVVALKGTEAAQVLVSDGKATRDDPLATGRTIGWKTWHAILITNQRNICRIVTACSA